MSSDTTIAHHMCHDFGAKPANRSSLIHATFIALTGVCQCKIFPKAVNV